MLDLAKLASGAAIDAAALEALAGFDLTKALSDAAGADELQALIDAGVDPNASTEETAAEGEAAVEGEAAAEETAPEESVE